MSKKQEIGSGSGWTFHLDKVGKSQESLKDPLGYKSNNSDVVVKNASGKKNMTQIEVLENVSRLVVDYAIESLGIRKVPLEADLHHSVHVLDDRNKHECLDHHDLYLLRPQPDQIYIHGQPR